MYMFIIKINLINLINQIIFNEFIILQPNNCLKIHNYFQHHAAFPE